MVTLSGGYDSRGILLFLREATDAPLPTLTWGAERIAHSRGSDAEIAAALSARVGATNRFVRNDAGTNGAAAVLNRFVLCGEGRTASVAGYLDGCEMWRHLREDMGVEGVVRGDEAFGRGPSGSERAVRASTGMRLASDVDGLPALCRKARVPAQRIPAPLRRRRGETLPAWRDRLYQTWRIPTLMAGLSEVKVAYVELVSPLVSHEVIDVVRSLPDRQRTKRLLFREIVDDFGVDLPFCTVSSEASLKEIMARGDIRAACGAELHSDAAVEVFPKPFLRAILDGASGRARESLAARFRRHLNRLRGRRPLDPDILLFRTYVIVRSVTLCRQLVRRN